MCFLKYVRHIVILRWFPMELRKTKQVKKKKKEAQNEDEDET